MKLDSYKMLEENSFLDGGNAAYLEELYEAFLQAPNSVPPVWSKYFTELKPLPTDRESPPSSIQNQFKQLARHLNNLQHDDNGKKDIGVRELIDAYRLLGHLQANLDPLNLKEKPLVPELTLAYYQLSEQDLHNVFDAGTLPGGQRKSLAEILEALQTIYSGSVATEFMHIPDSRERAFIQDKIENKIIKNNLSQEKKIQLLKNVTQAEGLEKYLGAKYPGAKRFSLEGLDTFIILLEEVLVQGSLNGVKEVVIGMAHRGRLNVLVNIFGKNPGQLFDEFEDKHHEVLLESGDVKYHQGFSSDIVVSNNALHLSLTFNPSHLEIVVPVNSGSVRARQERRHDEQRNQVLAIAVHGDAAFAGQGVVMETLNMSFTRGFGIGGSIHIIMNNQIGFTTSDPSDARSTLYCSDIGKMMGIPIFHVNANDPEAVYKVAQLAIEYRNEFKKDVIIDLVGYRRQGHNEADEPSVTQPCMYNAIRKLPTVYRLYADKLISEGIITKAQSEDFVKDYRLLLDNRKVVREVLSNMEGSPLNISLEWQPYTAGDWHSPVKTGVSLATIRTLATQLATLPEGFSLHPRTKKIMEDRAKMTAGSLPMDWGYAEVMAYASLLTESIPVRLTGEDCRRGTFFHRHVVLHDQNTGQEYSPLCHLSANQGKFSIYDSLLSEEAVLAFEYGYSTKAPRSLVIWEAQFGDFVNGAQVVIDQFISSGEQKWGQLSGLTLFLPHGFEGQGPEHSSARLERFLQLCAGQNMQVCSPTTPAQIFHLIRRQIVRPLRKPLVVMTPKSLLRHKLASSPIESLETGEFALVIPEKDGYLVENIKRVVFCTGKVYYDLLERRSQLNNTSVALIRIEQLYPFPSLEVQAILDTYAGVKDIVWCQEEPENQGAWRSNQPYFLKMLKKEQTLRYAGRKAAAAPAVGYMHLHHEQMETLLKEALE